MSSFTTSLFDSEWIPASRGACEPKVMIVLHGYGDSLKGFRAIKEELRLPGMNYLLLNGPRRHGSGFSWCALHPKEGAPSLIKTRARLFALVRELLSAGWASRDLFWLGHSQGAMIASDLVLHHPKPFGALIGVSGCLWLEKNWKRKALRSGAGETPWLMTHGTRDRIIRPEEIRLSLEELIRGPVRVDYQEFPKGHDFDFDHEVPFIRRWVKEVRESAR